MKLLILTLATISGCLSKYVFDETNTKANLNKFFAITDDDLNVQCDALNKNTRMQKADEALNNIEEVVQEIAKDGLNKFKESDKDYIPTITKNCMTSDDIENKKNSAINIAVPCASQQRLDQIQEIAKPNICHYKSKGKN